MHRLSSVLTRKMSRPYRGLSRLAATFGGIGPPPGQQGALLLRVCDERGIARRLARCICDVTVCVESSTKAVSRAKTTSSLSQSSTATRSSHWSPSSAPWPSCALTSATTNETYATHTHTWAEEVGARRGLAPLQYLWGAIHVIGPS